jgi:uncharacterized protein
MLRTVPIAIAALLVVSPATAASFDCKMAKLPVEVAVCSDPTLSAEDEELAREYSPLLKLAPADAVKTIKKEQKAWLASRNGCGSDMQCIMARYRERLQRFGEWRAQFAGAAPAEQTRAADPNAPTIDPNAPTITPIAPSNAAPAGDPNGDAN